MSVALSAVAFLPPTQEDKVVFEDNGRTWLYRGKVLNEDENGFVVLLRQDGRVIKIARSKVNRIERGGK